MDKWEVQVRCSAFYLLMLIFCLHYSSNASCLKVVHLESSTPSHYRPPPSPDQFTVFVHVWDCIFLSLYVYVCHSALRSWQERDFWRRILLPRWRLISLYRPLSRSLSRPYDRGTSPDRKRLARLVRLSLRPEPGSPSVHPGPTQSPLAVLTAASSSSLVPWSREAESSM